MMTQSNLYMTVFSLAYSSREIVHKVEIAWQQASRSYVVVFHHPGNQESKLEVWWGFKIPKSNDLIPPAMLSFLKVS